MSVRLLAKLAGISPGAVSLALRDSPKISSETKLLVTRLSAQLDYRANARVADLMAHVRTGRRGRHEACLGVCSFYDTLEPWRLSRHFERVFAGMKKRAQEMGYRLEPVDLFRGGKTAAQRRAALTAAGVEGLLCFGSPNVAEQFPPGCDRVAVVNFGLSIRTPLHRVTSHFYSDLNRTLDRLGELGYRRPGLVLGQYEENRTGNAYTGAYLGWCERHRGPGSALPILRVNQLEEDRLTAWLDEARPDVLVFVHLYQAIGDLRRFLRRRQLRVPDDLGVVVVSQLVEGTGFSGFQQNQNLLGAWMVEMVVGRIMSRDFGIPRNPRLEMVESDWIEGGSLRPAPPLRRRKSRRAAPTLLPS